MESKDLKGVIPAIATPFAEDGDVDESALGQITDHHEFQIHARA
jgi:dihydrodipicolinate synthase/N-acetylneuraminate lyase